MSRYIEPSESFHSVWPGVIGQRAVPGNYEGIWGDVATRSIQQTEFDKNQIASRQIDRAVGPGASGEHYLSHSQSIDPAAVARPEVISNVGYGARPKTTDSARQMDAAWTEVRPMALSSGLGTSVRSSNTAEAGQVLPGTLRQPGPPRTVRDYPQVRLDAPTRSTPVQSPIFYQHPSTGQLIHVPSNAASLLHHVSQRVSLIVIPGCLFVCCVTSRRE